MRQTYGVGHDWPSLSVHADDPSSPNFAILDQLESLRGSDGKFLFKLVWPDSGLGENVWKQTSNPTTTEEKVDGYEAVSIACSSDHWGGLATSSMKDSTMLDGSIGHHHWFYAVGASKGWKTGFPGGCTKPVQKVELYVGSAGQGRAQSQIRVLFAGTCGSESTVLNSDRTARCFHPCIETPRCGTHA